MDAPDPAAVDRVSRVKDAVGARLRAIPGVHGLGVGYKYRGSRPTDELAIVVFLLKKRPLSEIPLDEVIPREIEGVKTDVQEAEVPEFCSDDKRYRPLRGGIKINWTETTVTHPSPNTITTSFKERDGTLGCLARTRRTGKTVFLTNAHVVAGCADPATSIGRRIGQPDDDSDYTCCSKSWATVVGTVIAAKSHPLNPTVDVALVELDKCVDPSHEVEGLGPIMEVLTTSQLNALINQKVRVRGFKTAEVRQGTVRFVDHDSFIVCQMDDDPVASVIHNFEDAIVVESDTPGSPFSMRGDSGSVVLDTSGKVVGLLFGQGPVNGVPSSFVCRIDKILEVFAADLDLEILTAGSLSNGPLPVPAAALLPVHPSAVVLSPATASESFEPSPEDVELLGRARDEVLGTPGGQHLMQMISRHVQEVRELVRTNKRVAVVWRRVATPELIRAAVSGLRSPKRPLADLVPGATLPDRTAALVRVLARYGSGALVADLGRASPLAERFSSASYAEILAWLRTTPAESA